MAQYQDNNWYLDVDGTNLSSYLTDVTLTPSIAEVNITAGNVTHQQRGEGLKDTQISFTIYHDNAAAYSLALLTGTHTVTYGVEGSGSGKPKHVQSFIFTGQPHTTTVNKDMVTYAVTGMGATAPTTDMFAGGVWA